MSDNGESFFKANKATRQEAFHFPNQDMAGLDATIAGDQGARVHPIPAVLGNGQKVAPVNQEPAPESPAAEQSGRY